MGWKQAWVGATLIASCTDAGDGTDTNKPATFFDSCVAGGDSCAEPFECLHNPELTGAVCTLACEESDDCPAWRATGHCAGPFQSQCRSGLCQYGCE